MEIFKIDRISVAKLRLGNSHKEERQRALSLAAVACRKMTFGDALAKLQNDSNITPKAPGRWSLSPAYDLNPVPEMDCARVSKTAITESQEEPTIAGALAAATRFGLKATESKKILREVFNAVSSWRKTGRKLRLKAATLDAYASAFEQPRLEEAGCILGK